MSASSRLALAAGAGALAVSLAGCGSSGKSSAKTTALPATTTAPTTTPSPAKRSPTDRLILGLVKAPKGSTMQKSLRGSSTQLTPLSQGSRKHHAAAAVVTTNGGALVGYLTSAAEDARNVYKVGLHSTRLLLTLGDLVIGWLLLRQAEVALISLAGDVSDKDRAFYTGKVAAAQFFARTRLPLLTAERAISEAADLDLMDLDEAAF